MKETGMLTLPYELVLIQWSDAFVKYTKGAADDGFEGDGLAPWLIPGWFKRETKTSYVLSWGIILDALTGEWDWSWEIAIPKAWVQQIVRLKLGKRKGNHKPYGELDKTVAAALRSTIGSVVVQRRHGLQQPKKVGQGDKRSVPRARRGGDDGGENEAGKASDRDA